VRTFDRLTGVVAPLPRANVDTDQIIPKQFLKSIHRTGFGENLFDAWRFLDEGEIGMTPNERRINHEFVLNEPRYQDAGILLAGVNFACGSSREHAVWALLEYGFRCVIAPSFADIFYNNCFKNGLLPIVLKEEVVQELFKAVEAERGYALTVDLESQTVTTAAGTVFAFEIDPHRKHTLLRGLDDIAETMLQADEIRAFEAAYRRRAPWILK
jgi:3-isopropylmalate/(R)-2-methylmalate dehydratase small subunit